MIYSTTTVLLIAIIVSLAVSLFIAIFNYWNKKNQLSESETTRRGLLASVEGFDKKYQETYSDLEREKKQHHLSKADLLALRGDLSIANNKIIKLEADLKIHKPKHGPDGRFIKKSTK